MKSNYFRIILLLFILLIGTLYFFFRLTPLINQTVVYTYDQGRDFLKTAEVFLYKNPTFIGPTTGIMGIYHGAWWYYLLGIPFILFHGLPIGFYYFILLIQTVSVIFLFLFFKKYFGLIQALLILTVITFSPYFISTSFSASNTTIVLPLILLFLVTSFLLLEKPGHKKSLFTIFLSSLSLGFLMEFEFAFGLFLIPIYFFGVLIFKNLRKQYLNSKSILVVFLGLFLSLILRILFELKHGFSQTKILLNFFIKPKFFTPKPYGDVLFDRSQTFLSYFKSIFSHELITLIVVLFLIFSMYMILKNRLRVYNRSLVFFSYLLVMLFVFSTLYKDNFWSYYYEGIQYLILFIAIIFLSPFNKKVRPIFNKISIVLITMITFLGISSFVTNLKVKTRLEGLISMVNTVNYIQSQESNLRNYCVKIYTPPVIPYTYNYLFLYNEISQKKPQPSKDWTNNQCWIVIEKEQEGYEHRIVKWKTENIPANSTFTRQKKFTNTEVALFKIP